MAGPLLHSAVNWPRSKSGRGPEKSLNRSVLEMEFMSSPADSCEEWGLSKAGGRQSPPLDCSEVPFRKPEHSNSGTRKVLPGADDHSLKPALLSMMPREMA